VAGYIPWRFFNVVVDMQKLHIFDVVGMVISACGVAILLQSIVEFARRGRGTLSPLDPARKLVVTGLYRWVRNPMYLGVLLVLLGEVLIARTMCIARTYAAGCHALHRGTTCDREWIAGKQPTRVVILPSNEHTVICNCDDIPEGARR
jgi:protein-S-isoprenylcysteine O-methyltransferase Ste14